MRIRQKGLTEKQRIFRENLDNCFRNPSDRFITEQIEYNANTFEDDLFDAFYALYSMYQDASVNKDVDMFDFLRALFVGYEKLIDKLIHENAD